MSPDRPQQVVPPESEKPSVGLSATENKSWTNPERWVEAYGEGLFRHALMRVRDTATAEDLVQETLLAAWQSRDRYSGSAPERHWLFGILKNKLADYFRRRAREPELADGEQLAELEERQFESGWLTGRHWAARTAPRAWPHPAQSLERTEFWKTLHDCLAKLPAPAAQAFLLREVDDCDAGEICRTMNIHQNHLFVLMHRARLALRRCLELNWFREPSGGKSRGN